MAPKRIPTSGQFRAQMRAAQRKAEAQMNREVRSAQRQMESQTKNLQRKMERETKADLKKSEQDASRKLRSSRPKVSYTVSEQRYLAPIQEQAEKQAENYPARRDVFLCHAWDDREGAAQELHDLLESYGVSVWFSEKDVELGTNLIRSIDRGLKMSRIGIVLVTPSMFRSLDSSGLAEKELSALLATDRVIPVAHGTTFDELREESPLLASRSGLSTEDSSLEEVAVKIAETAAPTR